MCQPGSDASENVRESRVHASTENASVSVRLPFALISRYSRVDIRAFRSCVHVDARRGRHNQSAEAFSLAERERKVT